MNNYSQGPETPDVRVTRILAATLGVEPEALAEAVPNLEHATLATIRRSRRTSLTEMARLVDQSDEPSSELRTWRGYPMTRSSGGWHATLSLTDLAAVWRRSGR